MIDYTRLAAAGLIMLAMLIADCGGDDPISPTAPSATLTAGAAPLGQTAPTVSALGETAPTVSALGETGALETGETIGVDAEDAATSAAVSGVHTTINLSGIAWRRNAHNNKLIPVDAADNEGNGSAAAMAADPRVQLVHIWVRGNGTGLAVVDSHEDVAGEMLDLGGGIQYALTYRRGENPARFVTNLSADDVRSIEDRSGGEDKGGGGKGGDDDKGGDKGDDDDDGGVGSRRVCVANVRGVQTAVPHTAAHYTVAYDRLLTPGCGSYENHRYFGTDVSWISYHSATNDGTLITYSVAANTALSARTGNIWIIDIGNNNTPVGRITITQERAQHTPIVELSCARCEDVLPNGEPVDLTVVTSDRNGEDDILPNWEWTKVDADGNNAGVWIFGSGRRQWGPPNVIGRYTIGVTITDTTGLTASDSVNIDVAIFCGAFVSGILTDKGDGTGFLSTAERGFLHYKLEEGSHESCPVTVSSFQSTEPWVRGISKADSTRVGWDHVIEFQVDANPTSVVRSADVWLELKAPYIEAFPSQRITLQQAAKRSVVSSPSCPTTPITNRSTSWRVGDRYYGSGFTKPWAKMGYGTPGGCRVNGLSLSQPGRVRICGYNVADADARGACVAAPRAAAATHSTDPTAGAVTYVTSSGSYTTTATGNTAAAQWVEFLVDEKTPTGGTLSLAVGTSSGGVYLHFGYEHESDLSYGDSDYERWNVGTPTWTFSPAASTTSGSAVTHPTLTEHGRYPGVFLVTCAASNGRPTGSDTNADTDDGFSVRVSAAHGSPSVTYTASAAHPTYPRICRP